MSDLHAVEPIGFQVEDVLEILERRKWLILLAILVGLAVGSAAYMLLPPRYTASTTILVEPQEVPKQYVAPTVTFTVEQRLQTLRERVTSYQNLNDLIDSFGEQRLDPSGSKTRDQLMGMIRRGLSVEIGGRFGSSSSVFEVSYSGRDPEVVADVAREIASLFITENIKDRTRQATETAAFLDKELDRLRVDVTSQEEELRKFRQERMGALPDQLDANLRSLDRLILELGNNLEAQEAIAQRSALLQRQLAEVRGTTAGSGMATADDLTNALARARGDLLVALRSYTNEHPNVVRLQRDVARLEQEIARSPLRPEHSPTVERNPVAQGLRREIEAAQFDLSRRTRQETNLRAQIADIEARVAQTPAREEELLSLTRDYKNLTETYQALLAKKYDAAIARNLEQAQKGERFKVLRPARTPTRPSFPDLTLTLPAGVGISLALMGLIVAILEYRNPSYRSIARLSRDSGVPVVASIPRIDNDRIFEDQPNGDVDPRLVVFTAPESAPAEQYRGFVPVLLEDDRRKVVMVTSAARGDGKSLTTMNLALTVACDLDRRVLLIDADLRRPTAHRLVRISRKRGLSSVLRRQASLEECAVNSKIPNLTVLPAGPSVRSPLALLTGPDFIRLIKKAREQYDVIFIDTPPLLPVVDTRLLKRMADMVLFVVRADSTPRDAVVRSMRELRDVGGVVFNQVSPGSFRRYYYHDAYSRYSYGEASDSGDGEDEPRG